MLCPADQTMNVCSRIESTGRGGRVHASKETAQQLIQAGKEQWLEKREEMTGMHGKGKVQTYFLNIGGARTESISVASTCFETNDDSRCWLPVEGLDDRSNRLIDWNTEELLKLLQKVVANRSSTTGDQHSDLRVERTPSASALDLEDNPFDEVVEIIALPDFCQSSSPLDPDEVVIPPIVILELHGLVSEIAQLYNSNPFHNVCNSTVPSWRFAHN